MPVENPVAGHLNLQAKKEFKPWTCGEPYEFTLDDISEGMTSSAGKDDPDVPSTGKTKNGSDPWSFVVGYFATREKVRCDAWKDEVQNLLIFSGLFSAVVTAFLVESYKQLQEDTGAATVVLLSQLVSLANTSSSTSPIAQSTMPIAPFTPTSSSIRINIFWFLSLVFSLATAIIGIVSIQWVREHQRPTLGLSPRQEAALLHMNAEGIDRYYIPQIFSMLPLLLLIGLVFFLVGIVDFLWHLNHVVAIPILADVMITLALLLISTVLPGLQPLPIHLSVNKKNPRPPVLCPYKSPQSWVFLQMMGFIKRFFKWHFFKAGLPWLSERFPGDLRANWHDHGSSWLLQRDIHSFSTVSSDDSLGSNIILSPYGFLPQHDSLQALVHIQRNLTRVDFTAFVTLCKCFEDLSDFSFENEARHVPFLAAHLTRVLHGHYDYRSFIPQEILEECKTDPKFIVDVARLRFASRHRYSDLLALYYAQLSIRITQHLLSRRPAVRPVHVSLTPVVPMEYLADFFHPSRNLSSSVKAEILPQVQHLILQVFEHIADRGLLEDCEPSPQKYYVISEPMRHILQYGAEILMYDSEPGGTLHRTNDVIFTKTIQGLEDSTGIEADHLFALASIYVLDLLDANRSDSDFQIEESLAEVRDALRKYKVGVDARGGLGAAKMAWMEQALLSQEYEWSRVLGLPTRTSISKSISTEKLDRTGSVQIVPAVVSTVQAAAAQVGVGDLGIARPLMNSRRDASERPLEDGDMV